MFDLEGGKRRKSRGSKKSRKGSKKSRKASKKTRKGGKKNAFFTLMLKAKKDNVASFKYNGKTYHRKQKKHLVYYKA